MGDLILALIVSGVLAFGSEWLKDRRIRRELRKAQARVGAYAR